MSRIRSSNMLVDGPSSDRIICIKSYHIISASPRSVVFHAGSWRRSSVAFGGSLAPVRFVERMPCQSFLPACWETKYDVSLRRAWILQRKDCLVGMSGGSGGVSHPTRRYGE